MTLEGKTAMLFVVKSTAKVVSGVRIRDFWRVREQVHPEYGQG